MTGTLLLSVATLTAASIYLFRAWREALDKNELLTSHLYSTTAARRTAEQRAADFAARTRDLEAAVARLSQYVGVADAADEAKRLVTEAEAAAWLRRQSLLMADEDPFETDEGEFTSANGEVDMVPAGAVDAADMNAPVATAESP